MTKISQHIEALSKISKAITSELYLEDILKLIINVTAQVMGSRVCSLLLLDEKTKELTIRASQSVSEAYNKKPPLKLGEGIAGKVCLTKEPLQVYNVSQAQEYRYKDIAKKDGLVSLLCVPLVVKNKAIGVINIYTDKPHKFSKNEINTLTTIANQAALVIENTELMIKSKIIQEELETRKLIERAKGILMRKNNISEEEAYRLIQKYSMDKRKGMREIAEAVILADELRK